MIGIIGVEHPLRWISCRSISANLRSVYKKLFSKQLVPFTYSQNSGWGDAWRLARQIHDAGCFSKLVFVDHIPHPAPVLLALAQVYGNKPLPQLIFHVYGDFTLYAKQWRACEATLKGRDCLFICASPRHRDLLARLFKNPEAQLVVCPFPVDEAAYSFSETQRASWRKRLGIKASERVLLYSGRISLQKNILPLVRTVGQFIAERAPNYRLLLAGPIDDLGAPGFGIPVQRGRYQRLVELELASLPKSARERILTLGDLEPKDLSGVYSAADVFVSLSMHHNEDFGMAPAEAALCGLPLILSDWGGYAALPSDPAQGVLIPIELRSGELRLNRKAFDNALTSIGSMKFDRASRNARAAMMRERLSFAGVARALKPVLEKPAPSVFTGFAASFKDLELQSHYERSLFSEGPGKGGLYEEIYSTYLPGQ